MSELPPGFVLDQTEAPPGLPPGFVLDAPSRLEDAANSAGSGLANAAVGTVGGLGDIRSGLSSATDWAGGKLGVSPDKVQAFKDLATRAASLTPTGAAIANAPTSDQIKSAFPDPLAPYDYKPQYLTGDLTKKAAEFAPNMLLGGPESLGARLLTNVAAPAVGSVAGEKVAGPLGGIAGALVGAGGATAAVRKFQEMAAARQAANLIPSGEKLVETGGNQFNQARDMNVVVKPEFAQKTASDMRAALKDFDSQDASISDVFRKIDRLDNLGKPQTPTLTPAQRLQAEMNWEPTPSRPPPAPIEMNAVEDVRKQLSALRTSADAPTRTAAKKAQEVLTRNQMSLTPADVLSGDAAQYSKTMREAVGNYAAGKRSNTVTGKVDLAELNAGTAGSGANQDNALRQAIKQLARPVNNTNMPVAKKLGFNDAEVGAIKQAATGTAVGNTARYLGKYAPTGIVSAAGGAGLGHLVGGPVGAAIPAVGYIAKKIGDLSTKRAISAVDSLVRSRSPLAAQVASQLPPQIIQQLPTKTQSLLQSLVLADPVLSQQRQPVGQPNTYQAR